MEEFAGTVVIDSGFWPRKYIQTNTIADYDQTPGLNLLCKMVYTFRTKYTNCKNISKGKIVKSKYVMAYWALITVVFLFLDLVISHM